MDCAGVAGHLVGYHFATLGEAERDAIDAHLLGCKACLAAYFAFKRASEKSPLEKPSAAVKERLRASVLAAFPKPAARPAHVTLLARRIPLYQGLFAAALAAAIALAIPTLLHPRGTVREGAPQIDSARPHAEAFQIY
jgi:anti-sigma factor RsiW